MVFRVDASKHERSVRKDFLSSLPLHDAIQIPPRMMMEHTLVVRADPVMNPVQ
jgi:hypothetical protein